MNCYKKKKGITMVLVTFKKNELFMCYLIQFLAYIFFDKN